MKTKIPITFDDLYTNCIYSSIAHAIGNLKYPFLAYEQAWDGQIYCFRYDIAKGVIAFDLKNKILAGAATDDRSKRWSWYPQFTAIELFESASREVKDFANFQTLQYLLEEVDGMKLPVATTAFWSEDDEIVTSDSWEEFICNGGKYISEIICPLKELERYWEVEEAFSSEELDFLNHLFQMKMHNCLELSKEDILINDIEIEGYKEFCISLREIGFKVEMIDMNSGIFKMPVQKPSHKSGFIKLLESVYRKI